MKRIKFDPKYRKELLRVSRIDYLREQYRNYKQDYAKSKRYYAMDTRLTFNEFKYAYIASVLDRSEARKKGAKYDTVRISKQIAQHQELTTYSRKQARAIRKAQQELGYGRVKSLREIRKGSDRQTDDFWKTVNDYRATIRNEAINNGYCEREAVKLANKSVAREFFGSL